MNPNTQCMPIAEVSQPHFRNHFLKPSQVSRSQSFKRMTLKIPFTRDDIHIKRHKITKGMVDTVVLDAYSLYIKVKRN